MSENKLEHTVITEARDKLSRLYKLAVDFEEIGDVHSLFSELTGLTDLALIEGSGLSEAGAQSLSQIDQEALQVMRDLTTRKR